MTTDKLPTLIDRQNAAEYAGLSIRQFLRYLTPSGGPLRVARIGRRFFVFRDEFLPWLGARRAEGRRTGTEVL